MVRLLVTVRARTPRATADVTDALRFLALRTRHEPGCLDCTISSASESIKYVEEWAGEAEMRQRVRSDKFIALLSVIEAAEEPQVRFEFIGGTRGLDYVEEIRRDPGEARRP
jgi:quinol monooxygenase YgiN